MNTDDVASDTSEATTCSFITLAGAPNAGKSTLINQLAQSDVSIVTHKSQTTRATLRAIINHGRHQLVLSDTPGIFNAKKQFDQLLNNAASAEIQDADVTMLLVDVSKRGAALVFERFSSLLRPHNALAPDQQRPKLALILNKIDCIAKPKLLPLAERFSKMLDFDRIFMISALKGEGCEQIISWLCSEASEQPWHYPSDQLTDASLEYQLAEITRKQILLRVHDEIPYGATVETEHIFKPKPSQLEVHQAIYVSAKSHRPIILGAQGQNLEIIGRTAREEMEGYTEKRIYLKLIIKVRPNWQKSQERLRKARIID